MDRVKGTLVTVGKAFVVAIVAVFAASAGGILIGEFFRWAYLAAM